jgi:deoxyribodipyrimidine photolyase-related protein
MKTLRLILGDQLNYNHSWFATNDDNVTYVLMEIRQETDYVSHHAQKVIGIFAAMYNFSSYLRKNGHNVFHLMINDSGNKQSLTANLDRLINENNFTRFEYLLPDEFRLDEQLRRYCAQLSIESSFADTEHFLSTRYELKEHFSSSKSYLMESFYRMMRRKHNILMNADQPSGGKWNYDAENRKALGKSTLVPQPFLFDHDFSDIWNEIQRSGANCIGVANAEHFQWPVTRSESLKLLRFFTTYLLPNFGTYQDAMSKEHWALFHSRISFAMNIKMISPAEVIDAALREWENRSDEISLAQTEGFIRQILGWREFMRGVYWAQMPEFSKMNFFRHENKLPAWFWTAETKMNCLHHTIKQSLDHAYAHHIQRLMITGNFALLAGIHPDETDAWSLGIYIDAFEWVEITNTRGMSQFADGGVVATKPYTSSANYINNMSNYCKDCFYNHKEKVGAQACPFNSLYWDFHERHRDKLEKNPRIGMVYKNYDRMTPELQQQIHERAVWCMENVDAL